MEKDASLKDIYGKGWKAVNGKTNENTRVGQGKKSMEWKTNGESTGQWAVSRLREEGSRIKRELNQRAGNAPEIREV